MKLLKTDELVRRAKLPKMKIGYSHHLGYQKYSHFVNPQVKFDDYFGISRIFSVLAYSVDHDLVKFRMVDLRFV